MSDLVRDASDRFGLTQAALAERIGISREALSARLNGRAKWDLSEVVALSQLLDLNAYALLDAASDGGEVLAS